MVCVIEKYFLNNNLHWFRSLELSWAGGTQIFDRNNLEELILLWIYNYFELSFPSPRSVTIQKRLISLTIYTKLKGE